MGICKNGLMARSRNHSILLAGACQFTGLVLRLTISLIFLSINNLKHHSERQTGSPA